MANFNMDSSSDPTSHRTLQEEVNKMAKCKNDDSDQRKFIPVCFQSQIQSGTFELTLPVKGYIEVAATPLLREHLPFALKARNVLAAPVICDPSV